jgi:hypothetical protein
MPKTSFLPDIRTLDNRTLQHIEEGSVTAGSYADREIALKLVNDCPPMELPRALLCRCHHFRAP